MPRHIGEDEPVTPGSKILGDNIECSKLDVQASGFTTLGKGRAQDDYEVEDNNRGVVLRDQNNDRWRIGVEVNGGVPTIKYIPLDGQ